ncbi:MAG: DUF2007 domain-containing protein [Thermoleophilia bacterium]|jgi:hypothetical protein
MPDDIVLFKRYFSEMDAGTAKSFLECEGIPVMILSDDAGGMEPQFQLTQGVRLMVRREDLEKAHELLDEME